jgi:hypothetical protein
MSGEDRSLSVQAQALPAELFIIHDRRPTVIAVVVGGKVVAGISPEELRKTADKVREMNAAATIQEAKRSIEETLQ